GEGGVGVGEGKEAARQARHGTRTRCGARDRARGARPMIAALAAFQLASATALVVKTPTDVVRIQATSTANGPMISADALKRVMPIHVTRDSSSWFTIEVWGGKLQLQTGSTAIRVGDEIRPLVAAPTLRDGALLLPLQVVSEVFPALLPNIRWDAQASR